MAPDNPTQTRLLKKKKWRAERIFRTVVRFANEYTKSVYDQVGRARPNRVYTATESGGFTLTWTYLILFSGRGR